MMKQSAWGRFSDWVNGAADDLEPENAAEKIAKEAKLPGRAYLRPRS